MYEVVPKTSLQLNILREMYINSQIDKIDFWVPPRGINIPVHISVPPNSKIIGTVHLIGMDTNLIMDNVQNYIDQQNEVDLKFMPEASAKQFNYGEYHNLTAVCINLYTITNPRFWLSQNILLMLE